MSLIVLLAPISLTPMALLHFIHTASTSRGSSTLIPLPYPTLPLPLCLIVPQQPFLSHLASQQQLIDLDSSELSFTATASYQMTVSQLGKGYKKGKLSTFGG